MLYEALRILAYLSILTATSSSYLTKESLINYRRASPSSIPNDHLTKLSYDGEGLEWSDLNVEPSQPDYLIPQLVNTNNMLYTQLSSNSNAKNQKRINSRKLSQRTRGKKDNNKLVTSKNNDKLTNLIKNYDNISKRNKIENSVRSESNNDKNVSEKVQTLDSENDRKANFTNKSDEVPRSSHYQSPSAINNEYPNSQIPSENEHNRELQQLFGIEGAKKFQSYQLQQQLLNKNKDYSLKSDDEGVEIKEPQRKRNEELNEEEVQDVQGSMSNQLMPRTTRRQREYDVPLIQCPPATDGMERFACPTPDRQGRYRCIDDHVLCDGFIDCPEGADEDRQACMFYKTTKAHLDVLADALLRWARGR